MGKPQNSMIKQVDRPDLVESFSDSLGLLTFNDGVMRLEFRVIRYNEPKPPKPPTGTSYPVARLALSPDAAVDLYNRLSQLINAMEQQGLVKKGPDGPQSIQ